MLPHDHARSRAYRWGEDGLAGICDNHQRLCFALALWNERDPILKERLFGLTGNEGNHGEDVKEYYFYLDSTPTHSYMKWLYKYPQAAYPYADLIEDEPPAGPQAARVRAAGHRGVRRRPLLRRRRRSTPRPRPDDLLIRITATNRGPEAAPLHLLPTLWFRNTWSWDVGAARPRLRVAASRAGWRVIEAEHATVGRRWLSVEGAAELLFTENDSNKQRLWGAPNASAYVKDAFNDYDDRQPPRGRQSGAGRHEGRRPLPAPDRRRGHRHHLPAPDRRRAHARSVRQGPSTRCSPSACTRPTSSTRASRPRRSPTTPAA